MYVKEYIQENYDDLKLLAIDLLAEKLEVDSDDIVYDQHKKKLDKLILEIAQDECEFDLNPRHLHELNFA